MTIKEITDEKKVTVKHEVVKDGRYFAKVATQSAPMSAAVSEAFVKDLFPSVEINALAKELDSKIQNAHEGDMASIEAMLIAQALQSIFVGLARKSAEQSQLKSYGIYLTLALKAQSQSRATIQALTELKYPKQATFVKQTNISNGHQQVNNVSDTKTPSSHAKKIINQPNELLEQQHGSWMDTRKKEKAGGTDTAMAAVETKYRGQDC